MHADEAFKLWYTEIERQFPILSDAMVVAADTKGWGLAWYLGYRNGFPTFAVNESFTLNFKVASHEIGHALEDTIWKLLPSPDPMEKYWIVRGFPGTYQEAIARYIQLRESGGDPLEVWKLIPGESWAEAFAAVITGNPNDEWTSNYGKPINIASLRTFFESFKVEKEMTREEFEALFLEMTTKHITPTVLAMKEAEFRLNARTTEIESKLLKVKGDL